MKEDNGFDLFLLAHGFCIKFFDDNKISLCKTRENPIFSKKGKIVILVKNPKFILWISDDETDFTVGIVSRNLATTSNFIEFRDNREFHVFRGTEYRMS